MTDFTTENGTEGIIDSPATTIEKRKKGGKREGAGRPPKPAAGSLEDLFEQLNAVRIQVRAEAICDHPNPTKQRLLAGLDASLWRQIEFTQNKAMEATMSENAVCKDQVNKLQHSVNTLTPKAEGYDKAIKERDCAVESAKKSADKLYSTQRLNWGLLAFVDCVTKSDEPETAALIERRRKTAFKMLLSKQGDQIPNEIYEKFGVPISLWRQYKIGFTEQQHLLGAYEAATSQGDTEKAWFMQNRLDVEFGVKAEEAVRFFKENAKKNAMLPLPAPAGLRAAPNVDTISDERDLAGKPKPWR